MKNIDERIDDILTSQGLDLKSFDIHDDLNHDVWDDHDRLYPQIRKRLIKIAGDFLDTLKLNDVLDTGKVINPKRFVKDVLLLGSLASYNYSSYSDFDLHVLVDTSILKLSDDQAELLKQYFMLKKNEWNATHSDLTIRGFDVELYVQDVKDENAANGVYSVLHDRWVKFPEDMAGMEFDSSAVKSKALWYITRIDTLANMLEQDATLAPRIEDIGKLLKDKVVKGRRTSLNGDDKNEMATPNLVFKVLRRTGHLGKLTDLINKAYDLSMSINEDACCVAALGGDGFGDGKPALTKGDYHLPAVMTSKLMKRKMPPLAESTKITLTIGQLRRLIAR